MDYLSFFTNRLFPCITLQSHGYYSHAGLSNIVLSNLFPMSGTFVWEPCIPKHHLFTVSWVKCRAFGLWSAGQKRTSRSSKSLISTSVLLRDTVTGFKPHMQIFIRTLSRRKRKEKKEPLFHSIEWNEFVISHHKTSSSKHFSV